MSMRKFYPPVKIFESRKPSKASYKHYKVLIFISTIALALIFFTPIFAQSLLPSLSVQSQTSLNADTHLPVITISLKSGPASNVSTPLETGDRKSISGEGLTNLAVARKLPVLKSRKVGIFDQRVKKFLASGACEALFFMIWISPAPLFSKREILSLESLFKSHQNGCLIILSKTLDSPRRETILKPISDLGFNILPIAPDIPLLFRHTPALKWYKGVKKGEIDTGQVPFAQNLSNLMRLVFLYKYGGVYLDTDFIILRNFSGLKNSIGAQSLNEETGDWSRLNNAVLIFDKAHPLVLRFIKEFVARFNGNKWGHNGPYLVSRVIEKVKIAEKKKMNDGGLSVYNFTVLPPEAFYPANWNRISGLFERPKTAAQTRWAKAKLAQLLSGSTYGIHLWHKQTSGVNIEKGSIMAELISDHCIICQEIFTS